MANRFLAIRDGGKTDEEGASRFLQKLAETTEGIIGTSSFAVSEKDPTPDMSVDIAIGDAFIEYLTYGFYVWTDAIINKTVATADPTDPRIDAVVAYIDLTVVDSTNPNNPDALIFKVVTGTPAASPVAPTDGEIQTSVGAGNPWTKLAEIAVAASATSIVDANITDLRVTYSLRSNPKRVVTITSSATPAINTDNYDVATITALAEVITSMTTNLSGTPTNFQTLIIRILDDGTGRAITWGASFQAMGVALPTTTIADKVLTVGFLYDTVDSKWGCVVSVNEA